MDKWIPLANMLGNLILKYADQLIGREEKTDQKAAQGNIIELNPHHSDDSPINFDIAA